MEKTLDTPFAFLSFEDDILLVKMKEGINLGEKEMELLLQDAVELTSPNKYFAIIDTTVVYDSTPEARDFYSESDYSKYRYADAFIVNSLPMRLLVNFFKKKELNWHSEFKRDINSTGGIVNGNTLRSEWLELQMENNSTGEVNIEEVKILITESKKV